MSLWCFPMTAWVTSHYNPRHSPYYIRCNTPYKDTAQMPTVQTNSLFKSCVLWRHLSTCNVIHQSKVTSEGHLMVSKCQAVTEENVLVLSPPLRMRQSLLHKKTTDGKQQRMNTELTLSICFSPREFPYESVFPVYFPQWESSYCFPLRSWCTVGSLSLSLVLNGSFSHRSLPPCLPGTDPLLGLDWQHGRKSRCACQLRVCYLRVFAYVC